MENTDNNTFNYNSGPNKANEADTVSKRRGSINKYNDENSFEKDIPVVTTTDVATLQKDVGEAKNKLRIITQKFSTVRKERDSLKKENKELQDEIIALQSSIRQMVPGSFSNTSSIFPMSNEIISQASEFYKCDCQDIFFDILCPELNMDGIVFFYQNTLPQVGEIIKQYFVPAENALKKTACLESLDGPIMNVLRKSFQNNWKSMFASCIQQNSLSNVMQCVQSTLKLGNETPQVNNNILVFLKKLSEICFCLHICDPQLIFDLKSIGERVTFNALKHESVDGFVKNKQECIVLLPSIHKENISGDVIVKAQILSVDYDFP